MISNKFLYSKDNINDLFALKDILMIYKYKKSKGLTSTIGLAYYDKFGKKHIIIYSNIYNDCVDIDNAIEFLSSKCKKAKIGYCYDNVDYVSKNIVNFNDDYQYNKIEVSDIEEERLFEEHILEVLKIFSYEDYETFKNDVYNTKKIPKLKFETKKEEIDYLVQALGYNDFYDFYESNIKE